MKTIEICNAEPIPFGDRDKFTYNTKAHAFLNDIPENAVACRGYHHYLAKAWGNHHPVTLSPSDIWYMIICELTLEIAKQPKNYAELFTTTPDSKQLILVPTNDPTTINVDMVIDRLKDCIPTNTDAFLPNFSTDTPMIRLALNVAFCDMVSPFYEYMTFMCGIPAVHVLGNLEDWALLRNNLNKLIAIFPGHLGRYLTRCHDLVAQIINEVTLGNAANFFARMVKVERCGSGGEREMGGWIMHFLNRKDYSRPLQLEGLHPHASKMTYTNLETQWKFELHAGIFYCHVNENGILIPDYSAFREDVTNKQPKKEKQTPHVASRRVNVPIQKPERANYKTGIKMEDLYTKIILPES